VLRGIDLDVEPGEALAIVGASGAGKSTLLLCAAGLMRADSGDVRWFGESSRDAAARRVRYYCATVDLWDRLPYEEAQIHLVDLDLSVCACGRMAGWIRHCCALGDSVIVVSRDARPAQPLVDRVLTLFGGTLRCGRLTHARVAERAVG
jgi:ABC-type sulfate/molybdate transport systems ATPase subunit